MPDPQDLFARGNRLLAEGRAAEALACYRDALQLRPGHADTLANLGVACAELGRPDEAVGWYDAALKLDPTSAEAHYNRGNALRQAGRFAEALAAYDAAVRLRPPFAEAWANRGLTLMRLGRAADAAASYRRALDLRPPYPEAINNLGLALQALGYVEDALDHFGAALQQRPDYAPARSNRAQALLLKGDFRRGWPEYEWRWALPAHRLPPRDLPAWDGSPLGGRSVLLRHEQGLGDTLQFVRYAPLVKARGGRVVLECPVKLHPLLAGVEGVDALVDRTTADTGCELQQPLLSLPWLFRTGFRTIPARVPYLAADPARLDPWRARLPGGRLRVGICWQGSRDYPEDAFRSIPLSAFAPLAAVPGVALVSLQKGDGVDQVPAFRERHPLHELPPDLDAGGAFLDTAAVMAALDLVVTCDTAIGHLAGALGRPVWLALPVSPDWRWLRDRDDSPWYPTARLFRQSAPGDWGGVFEHVREELAGLAGSPPATC